MGKLLNFFHLRFLFMQGKFFLENKEFLVCESVYSPSEDSFLLSDAIKISKGAGILDLGCGTGIQGLTALLQGACFVCFADKNPAALKNARQNFEILGIKAKVSFVKSDLFSGIRKKFDFIFFNPPYVPSSEKKFLDLDGGKKGRETLDRFLNDFPKFLLPEGKVFFLQSSLNGNAETSRVLKKLGFKCKIIARKKLFFEELAVFLAWKE